MKQEPEAFENGSISCSVIYFTPQGGRFSYRHLSVLLSELDVVDESVASIEVILAGAFDYASLDERTTRALTALFAAHPRLKLGPLEAAASGGALLNITVNQARGKHIVFLDSRAYIKPEVLIKTINAISASPAVAMFAPQPEQNALLSGSASQDSALDLLMLLLRKLKPYGVVAWNADLHHSIGQFDEKLSFTALNEFLIRVSSAYPVLALEAGLANLPPSRLFLDKQTKHQLEQKALDEELRLFDSSMERVVKGELTRFSTTKLTKEMTQYAKTVMEQLRLLQGNKACSLQALLHSTFSYALLSLRFDHFDNAREILGTVMSIAREQEDVTRLYKWLILNNPKNSSSGSSSTRITAYACAPVVSIITPLYNQGHYLHEAVRSVCSQSYPHWEMLIINDGSSDDSLERARELLNEIDDPRIRLVSQENRGKGATRNRGVHETSGPYLVCLDSDDLLAPNYFAIGIELMKKNDRVGWITPKTVVFGGSNHIAWSEEYDFVQALLACPSPSSSMFRRAALAGAGLYREDLTNREDFEVLLRLAEQGWISKTSSEPLFFYRHALRRPGLTNISNIPSKEEICSLHPWWYRMDYPKKIRYIAYKEFKTFRLPQWFLNMDNINRIAPVLNDKKLFLKELSKIKKSYPLVDKPQRWNDTDDGDYKKRRDELYGVRRTSAQKESYA